MNTNNFGRSPKKSEIWFLQKYVAGSLEAWHNATGTNSNGPLALRKSPNNNWFLNSLQPAKFEHLLDVYSAPAGVFELIPFALSQASWASTLGYQ